MAGETLRSAVALVVLAAATAALGGCGTSQAGRTPDVRHLPLVTSARIVSDVRVCDRGAKAYCALELVVVDNHYKTSTALVSAQHAALIDRRWSGANADNGYEHAADSPGHKLRVTYASAYGDLVAWERGWVKRSHATTLALSRVLFGRASAMSLLLEVGSG